MMRLNLPLTRIALAAALAVPFAAPALAADDVMPRSATADKKDPVYLEADAFWHYARIGNYKLADAAAVKLIARSGQERAVLDAFEAVAAERKENLLERMAAFIKIAELRDSVTKIDGILSEARRQRNTDPKFIEQNILMLREGSRGYAFASVQLKQAGEVAMPLLLNHLRDPQKVQYSSVIRRAIRDMGPSALVPLITAAESSSESFAIVVAELLGDLGYKEAVPVLVKLSNSERKGVAGSAAAALTRLGSNAAGKVPAALYYDLANDTYNGRSAVAADPRTPEANIWYWDEAGGLSRKVVAPAIYAEIMTMRFAHEAMKLGYTGEEAQALWLAANYRREADLPAGATDATRPENNPDANFYGVQSGARYLNLVLARGLGDKDTAVALRTTVSFNQVAGVNNLFASSNTSEPLVDALGYTEDARVRYEAALALAAALPTKSFTGQEQVVNLLADAVKGGGNLDEATGTAYALRAAEALRVLALRQTGGKSAVFDVSAAESTLLAALGDKRSELVIASAAVLATLDSKNAQVALVEKAADEKTAEPVRVALFNALAVSAKGYGNRINPDQVENLNRITGAATTPPAVRSAAAAARGALNLPADQARTLILDVKP